MTDVSHEFGQVWDARESIYAAQMVETQGVDVAAARQQIRAWVEITRETHRKIAVALSGKMALPRQDLLDLFSGPAIVPYTLQIAHLVNHLTLLDRDEWRQFGVLHSKMHKVLVEPAPTVIDDNLTNDRERLLPNVEQLIPDLVFRQMTEKILMKIASYFLALSISG